MRTPHPALLIVLFFIFRFSLSAQEKDSEIVKDLDSDSVADTVYFDADKARIVCKLSTQRFRLIISEEFGLAGDNWGVSGTDDGFRFSENWMRAGYSNSFAYNPEAKRMQLIGMSRYEFGNAANDGSGESSVNLLTGEYEGNWNYYDLEKDKLIAIPAIKTKMLFHKIYLEDFSDAVYFDFADRCSELYQSRKNELINR